MGKAQIPANYTPIMNVRETNAADKAAKRRL